MIKHRLRKIADDELTNGIRQEIQDYLEIHYGNTECQEFLQTSSFLDPRYKARFSPDIEEKVIAEARALSRGGEPVTGIAFMSGTKFANTLLSIHTFQIVWKVLGIIILVIVAHTFRLKYYNIVFIAISAKC